MSEYIKKLDVLMMVQKINSNQIEILSVLENLKARCIPMNLKNFDEDLEKIALISDDSLGFMRKVLGHD